MRVLLFILVIAIAAPLAACAWDRDTLQQEAEGIDDILGIVAGDFPRYPALYYEMRLERIDQELLHTKGQWDLYDDAAVAADRIGLQDKAIELMEAKMRAMEKAGYDGASHQQPNHSYRTKANLGTFYAHRWFAQGKDFSKLEDILKARDLIAAAIEENPDAHFGREKYQLRFLEWLAEDPSKIVPEFNDGGSPRTTYPDFLGLHESGKDLTYEELDEAIEGLAGLMKMGAAWESLDVLLCMEAIAYLQRKTSIANFIGGRIEELQADGRDFLLGSEMPFYEKKVVGINKERWNFNIAKRFAGQEDTPKEYWPARGEALARHLEMMAFLMPKLKDGQHPDTEEEFRLDLNVYYARGIRFSAEESEKDKDHVFEAFVDAALLSPTFANWFWGAVVVLLGFGGICGSMIGRWRLRKKLAA